MPVITLPIVGEVSWGNKLRTAIETVNNALDDLTVPVDKWENLPTTGNWVGRTKFVTFSVASYVWTGAEWASLGLPCGFVDFSGAAEAEPGYVLGQGQDVSRTTYAELYAKYGTTYGAGDGSTTFGLPDLRARSPFGVKSGDVDFGVLGGSGGSVSHDHGLEAGHARIGANAEGTTTWMQKKSGAATWSATSAITTGVLSSTSTGSATALGGATDAKSSLPPFVSLTPLIKV